MAGVVSVALKAPAAGGHVDVSAVSAVSSGRGKRKDLGNAGFRQKFKLQGLRVQASLNADSSTKSSGIVMEGRINQNRIMCEKQPITVSEFAKRAGVTKNHWGSITVFDVPGRSAGVSLEILWNEFEAQHKDVNWKQELQTALDDIGVRTVKEARNWNLTVLAPPLACSSPRTWW